MRARRNVRIFLISKGCVYLLCEEAMINAHLQPESTYSLMTVKPQDPLEYPVEHSRGTPILKPVAAHNDYEK